MFNPLRNVVVNLQATGPAAVLCVLIICITTLGILGSGPLAERAMYVLTAFAGFPRTLARRRQGARHDGSGHGRMQVLPWQRQATGRR
jgi:hypothetical protein